MAIDGQFIFDNLQNGDISQELKLWAIMNLLHDGLIGIHKAGEMCQESGIFDRHWFAVQSEIHAWGGHNARQKRIS